MKRIINILSLVTLTGLSPSTILAAENYPEKPITFLVPFSAGGGADAIARLLAKEISPHLGNANIIVENKAGASGNIGAKHIEKQPADGHSFLITNSTLAINYALNLTGTPNIEKSLQPVSLIVSSPVAIGINPTSLKSNDLQGLFQELKTNKNLSYSSCGSGTPQNFAGELINQKLKSTLTHIPYKGCAPAITDGIGNQVPVLLSTIPNLAPHAGNEGKLKILAVTSKKRASFLNEVPSISELKGFEDFDISVWFGLFAQPGIPAARLEKFQEALRKTMSSEKVKKQFADMFYEIEPIGSEQIKKTLQTDIKTYRQIAKKSNITLQ